MSAQDDVAVAREAVRALERAVSALSGHYGQSVELRRLQVDAGRVAEDVDLLCGPEQEPAPAPVRPLEVIEDRDYEHSFWMDAEDEGLGRADTRPR